MPTAIKIEGLSKKYIIGHHRQDQYTTFRDVLMHKLRGLGQRIRHPISPNQEEIEQEELWALRDINLEINQGERIGIIGRNGAGKSTLLKVLSRITQPTEGRFTMNGRVASLLEVGTGFHPELTGRENIFLNGAILGMSRTEIKQKFDEIVDFAETEKFLDTPVKRYSSGMYVRLAFAVAAHLEPDILVVDEVLAVGDTAFQKKCLGKMKEVGSEGRTVLFVSHRMETIENLCDRAILLDNGRVDFIGPVSQAISRYSQQLNNETAYSSLIEQCNGPCEIKFSLNSESGELANCFSMGQNVTLNLSLHSLLKVRNCHIGIGIDDLVGNRIVTLHTMYQCEDGFQIDTDASISINWHENRLVAGSYRIVIAIYDAAKRIAYFDKVCVFDILASDFFRTGKLPAHFQGKVVTQAEWKIQSDRQDK
jgi:lipopolysaccharide transport system ATP-binding protein